MSSRRWVALLGLAGAIPTLLWAASGSGLIFDDWRYADVVHFQDVWHLFSIAATKDPGRPVQAAYYAVTYGLFGTHPLGHALALAALNALAAGLVFLVAERLWDRRVALVTALAWVALPNRGSTRLWFATAPAVLSLCLLLVAALLLTSDRVGLAAVVVTLAVLTYESVLALGVGALVLWAWRQPRGERRAGVLAVIPVAAAATYIWTHSPKTPRGPNPIAQLPSFTAAEIGRGVFGSTDAARVVDLVVLLVLATATYRALAPGHTPSDGQRLALQGVAVVALGAAPFLVTRFPFATDGIFDRGNATPDLGVALILGAIVVLTLEHAPAVVAIVVAGALFGLPAYLNKQDLHDYRRAIRQGKALESDLIADVPPTTKSFIIGPPLPTGGGVAQFLASDIGIALDFRWHETDSRAHMACSAEKFALAAEAVRYDRITRRLERRVGPPPPNAVRYVACQ